MWAKLDDSLLDHVKLLRAADRIGRNGEALALAAFAGGLLYCAKSLSDGFIPARVVLKGGVYSDQPVKVAAALVEATLWHQEDGGYRVHDYHDLNREADDVKAKRKADADRKREERRRKRNGHES